MPAKIGEGSRRESHRIGKGSEGVGPFFVVLIFFFSQSVRASPASRDWRIVLWKCVVCDRIRQHLRGQLHALRWRQIPTLPLRQHQCQHRLKKFRPRQRTLLQRNPASSTRDWSNFPTNAGTVPNLPQNSILQTTGTFVLRTTCMRSLCNLSASCMAA